MWVPLVEQLMIKLKELKLQSGGNPWGPSFKSARAFERAEKSLGQNKKRARITNMRVHDLRRTVASYECMNGVNLSIVSKTLNHKTLSATQVYARVDISAVAQALQGTVNIFESFK